MSKVIKKQKGTVSHYDDDSFLFLGTDDTVFILKTQMML